MGKHRDLDRGNVLPATLTDELQEYIGTLDSNIFLRKGAGNTVEMDASPGNGQVSLGFGGPWRFNDTPASAAHPGGPEGTYDIYAVASANDFPNAPLPSIPDVDATDYTFGLQIVPLGEDPSGTHNSKPITLWRAIGDCDWFDEQITAVRQHVGAMVGPHRQTHSPGSYDELDYAAIQQMVLDRGLLSERPPADPDNEGFLFFATDEQIIYRSLGTNWEVWGGPGAGRFSKQVGDGINVQIDVKHSLGTRNLMVELREYAVPYRQVFAEVQFPDDDTVRLLFDTAPAVGALQCTIFGGNVGTSVVGVSGYATSVGNGVARALTVSHGLGTRDLIVSVRETASPFRVVDAEVEFTDLNTLTVTFAVPPTVGQYSVFVGSAQNRTGAASQHRAQHIVGGSDALVTEQVLPVLDVGALGQTRAGHRLVTADFGTAQPPRGLWGLSDLVNAGTDGRTLTNKGAVPFGKGISGLPAEAAIFAGATAQALFIADSGSGDSLRIRSGGFGCWFRTARHAQQIALSKGGATPTDAYRMQVGIDGKVTATVALDATGGAGAVTGTHDLVDDRWHFAVVTFDNTMLRLYIDGVLDASALVSGQINPGGGPFNIGSLGSDGSTAGTLPFYGRIDEAFVCADVLSEDHIRLLYAIKLTHGLGVLPRDGRVSVLRRKRGAALATTDFLSPVLRLYHFTGGDLTGAGTDTAPNRLLTNSGGVAVAGADGLAGGAFGFVGSGSASLAATDAGLPAAKTARSYGCWFKSGVVAAQGFMGWGTVSTGDARIGMSGAGSLLASNGGDAIIGPAVADSAWHMAVVVEEDTASDGLRRKVYLDGRLVGASTVLNAITLAGSTFFRVGAYPNGTSYLTGQIDNVFVCGYALGIDEIVSLYAKGVVELPRSPKNPGDHIEAIDTNSIYAVFDTLASSDQVSVGVAV